MRDKFSTNCLAYDAGGERTIKYVLARTDARYSAKPSGSADRFESIIYPNALVTAKTLDFIEQFRYRKDPKLVNYTKHYYIGSERIASSIGTKRGMGGYLGTERTSILDALNEKVEKAGQAIHDVFDHFGKHIQLPEPFVYTAEFGNPWYDFQDPEYFAEFWYHPDHLGSSSYITNLNGEISQHMEYLPFGETLVEEHLNSNNSPYKFNAKEFDAETGNYYYGARYYDPKWSFFISVDPLADADKNIGYSPYSYAINNPISYIDPDGRCWQKVGEEYVPCNDASVGSTTTGAFGNSWTMTENNGWQLTNGADPSTVNYQYDHIEPTGDASYYVDRYKNHIEKYNTRPPDYYLGYGHKYINRFKNETRGKLTALGQEWLDETAVALQQMMNLGIDANRSIQGDNAVFQDFAYKTHVPAYSGSGKIGLLQGNDLWHIMWTPDIKDSFLSPQGRSQIKGMFPHILKSPRNPDLWDPQKNPGLKRRSEY